MRRRVIRAAGLVVLAGAVAWAAGTTLTQKAFAARLNESKALINAGSYEEALKRLAVLAAEEGLSPSQTAACAEAGATACCWAHEFEQALAWLAKLPAGGKDLDAPTQARCRKLEAWAREGLGQFEQALTANRAAVALARQAGDKVSKELLAEYLSHTAKTLRRLEKYDEAAALYREAAQISPIPAACIGTAELALRAGQGGEALRAWVALCGTEKAEMKRILELARAFHEMAQHPAKAPDPAPILELRSQWLSYTASRPEVCEQVQWVLVDLLLAHGQAEPALREGRALLEGCSGDLLPEVAGRLSLVLKRLDGSVARANQVLELVRWGAAGPDGNVGTADDIADPFADADLAEPARDQAFAEALTAQGDDWRGHLARATLYRYQGKTREALPELKRAFDLAPMEEEPIRAVAQATMRVLTQLTGSPAAAERYADFQRYGTAGPDGKAGSADDLTDPVAALLK